MVKFKGIVFAVQDDMKEFHDKDKDGNRLPTKTAHRITQISMSVKNGKMPVAVTFSGFDLPANFQLPHIDQEWESPSVREFKQVSPLVCECRL